VRYWDASALVPLVIAEDETARMRSLLREDAHVVTWAWTSVELASAVERRARAGELDRAQRRAALRAFEELSSTYDEVTDVLAIRRRALSLLARHPLRAADAAQLAAALLVAPESGPSLDFVCLDERLAEAAEREGLTALPAPDEPASLA
jgi:predicted nucleic acid-binding protein